MMTWIVVKALLVMTISGNTVPVVVHEYATLDVCLHAADHTEKTQAGNGNWNRFKCIEIIAPK